jgi:hypothetical protein
MFVLGGLKTHAYTGAVNPKFAVYATLPYKFRQRQLPPAGGNVVGQV